MKVLSLFVSVLLLLGSGVAGKSASPEIQIAGTNGLISWNSGDATGLTILEMTTDLNSGVWHPIWYDLPTNQFHSLQLPVPSEGSAFYRLNVQDGPADPSLLLHLPFDNDFSNGVVVDASGNGNHGLRYGRPCCPTNWPTATVGPDGSQAGNFNWYGDGYGLYGRSGDYVGVPSVTPFLNMTQVTVSAWARFRASYTGSYVADQNSTILYSGHATTGAWYLGRYYNHSTAFNVFTNETESVQAVYFPDNSLPDGDTDRWNHYLVTFDSGVLKGYFNGVCFMTNTIPVTQLTAAGTWLGIAAWTFNKDPWMDLAVDGHPNNAWVNGTMDDLRIYNRALSNAEVETLYYSFDKAPPSQPLNLVPRAESSSQVSLRWSIATDIFGVVGYQILRDGVVVGQTAGTFFLDENLNANQQYAYTLKAFDRAGNLSASTSPALVTTFATPGAVDMILDNRDPSPFVNLVGGWASSVLHGGFYGVDYLDDLNAGKGTKSATFRPSLPEAGTYQVYLRWTARSNRANNTPVTITTATLTNTIYINQKLNNNTWISMGNYAMTNDNSSTIEIRNDGTIERVIVDALRIIK
ncbi:MAG: hypothetical protein H7Y43_17715 [Akkermansiaceae bacterium]|nr:hypothetical protein [Verrucomicrobiales bacterium]